MAENKDGVDVVYALIANIPSFYHSSHLRNYFSQLIESKGFDCFHFRHRPERRGTEVSSKCKKTTCCIVRVNHGQLLRLQKMYHRRHWLDEKGDAIRTLCFVSKIKITPETKKDAEQEFKTRGELKKIPSDRETFTLDDLVRLPEMNPPALMPNGNVGTPTNFFMQLIQKCQLPPKLISKLGLTFPKKRSNRRYCNVAFDYGFKVYKGKQEDLTEIQSGRGHEILSEGSVREKSNVGLPYEEPIASREKKECEDDEQSEVDGDDCEEWERHEAFNDDPSNQERNKERLYEEELEIVWEKGGPGIVWYTDAQFWDQQDGDEEEKDVDDWDVDMSEYYERGSGDKDAQDFMQMRRDMRLEQGLDSDNEELSATCIGKFERHTKGIGRKVMRRQGWTEGQGLGSSVHGMADALDNEGQKPYDKRGFGYRGEKVQNKFARPPAKRKLRDDNGLYRLNSIYDSPKTKDAEETLTRRPEPYNLKYRDGIRFIKFTQMSSEPSTNCIVSAKGHT